MIYKVVPFMASVTRDKGASAAAEQLEQLVMNFASNGWEYVRLESVETYVAGTAGCFGLGAQPAHMTSVSMVVFRK